ncbi:ABC transporter ATP-binding protein [Geopsychrobacter electrodiphilus]|uniref:ABC transporter ATP-binding protein n=1 Tax=Geopsychrobacter electrodiphilus TaxID=225196 RepID=UPI00037B2133|nr:ABC transporter ATP-binding protein [Geopsychrobacter electrodiphilus]
MTCTDCPEILVRDLRRSFGKVAAVDGIDLHLKAGELFAFLGPNGAGKTTTINMLTGLLRPDSGLICYQGELFTRSSLAVRKRIGVVPQHNNLDRELTAAENLQVHGRLFGMSGPSITSRVEVCLELAGLLDKRDTPAQKLSGGMKRKLVIARALLHEPSILFLDEPTAGLDPHSRRRIWAFLRRINQEQNCTLFLTTHYIEEAEQLAERVCFIDQGQIIAEGSPQALREQTGRFVLDIYNQEDVINEFFNERAEAMLRLKQIDSAVRIRETTLEDVFLQLTGKRIEP